MYLVNHKVVLKTREELADAIENARSIGAYNQPSCPVYAGSCDTGNNVYHYYRDSDGKYYYQDERCLQFENIIKEHTKGRKRHGTETN